MSSTPQEINDSFSYKRLFIPLLIGVIVTALLIYFKGGEKGIVASLEEIDWSFNTFLWIFIAIVVHALRDVAYMWRFRILTDKKISWRKCFDVIMMWETASAIAPSSAGGTSIAMFIINREGINLGKSTSILMLTLLLDKLFYILAVPALVIMVGTIHIFPENMRFVNSLEYYIWGGYIIIVIATTALYYGVFRNPTLLKNLIVKTLFFLPFLKRFRKKAVKTGNEILTASVELKTKPFSYFFEAFIATSLSWAVRFLVLNLILMALVPQFDHVLIYLRQLLAWLLMLIPSTPGASGVVEGTFSGIMKDVGDEGIITVAILLWRFITYYPYIFIGILIFPKWLKRTANVKDPLV
jgi:uncharacterized protein (TIRG00374 family)